MPHFGDPDTIRLPIGEQCEIGRMMEYRVKPVGKTCAATLEPFLPGATVCSALLEQDGELVRLDFSEQGWAGPPEGAIGWWRAVVPRPEDNKPKPLDAEALLDQFQQLLEDANPAQEQMCYVMALLLLQKRRLSLDGSRIDGEITYLQLSGSRGEGPFEVRDQQLSGEQITSIQLHLQKEWKSAA